jgi:hypothetical protein
VTARLAVVAGAFGAVSVDTEPQSKTWGKVTGNVVIPYDACWTNSTADAAAGQLVIAKTEGAAQTNALSDASGYFGWNSNGATGVTGTFNLVLTFHGANTEWDAVLARMPDGTMIRLQ